MDDSDIFIEFFDKVAEGNYGDDLFLLIASIALEGYAKRRRKEFKEHPGIGAESFKGVADGDL